MKLSTIHQDVQTYFHSKINEFGPTPQGLDWNSQAGQLLRFDQLLKLCNRTQAYSLIDLGCGYGALLDYLKSAGDPVEYRGLDLSEAMILEAQKLHPDEPESMFELGITTDRRADHVVASGIFNVKQQTSGDAWHAYIVETIRQMAHMSTRGFAFNCLTSYSDIDRQRPDLYYANPCWFFDYCKRTFSRQVSLLHDYGLYEFTILVRYDL